MKHQTPELYETYVFALRKTVESDIFMREAPYRIPDRGRSQGQRFGLLAVVGGFAVSAWFAYLGHEWIGGGIAIFDVIGLAAVFNGNQGKRQRKSEEDAG
ncbi:hypothetical protein [Mycolicibacterium setense]